MPDTTKLPRKVPLDRLAKQKTPVYFDVWIPLDSSDADEFNDLTRRLNVQRQLVALGEPSAIALQELADLEVRYDSARDGLRDRSICFRAVSIGHRRYGELRDKHPATADQIAEAKKDGMTANFNPLSFPKAAVAACVKRVLEFDDKGRPSEFEDLTQEFVDEVFAEDSLWNEAETIGLFTACEHANVLRRVVELGNGSRLTRS